MHMNISYIDMCPMLPVSLDYPFLISPTVFYIVYLEHTFTVLLLSSPGGTVFL